MPSFSVPAPLPRGSGALACFGSTAVPLRSGDVRALFAPSRKALNFCPLLCPRLSGLWSVQPPSSARSGLTGQLSADPRERGGSSVSSLP